MITLLASTNQEAFDKVVAHLKTLPHRSTLPEGVCVYNHEFGGCAIGGPLLTANDAIECDNASWPSINSLIRDGVVDPGDISVDLLSTLQAKHDTSTYWNIDDDEEGGINDECLVALRVVGRKFGLDVSAV